MIKNIFDWKETLNFCEELKNQYLKEDNIFIESVSRTIINRAYYLAYRSSNIHLENRNLYKFDEKIKSKSSHQDMIDKLVNLSITASFKYRNISFKLYALKKIRQRADYNDICLDNPRMEAIKAISIAKEILIIISELENN